MEIFSWVSSMEISNMFCRKTRMSRSSLLMRLRFWRRKADFRIHPANTVSVTPAVTAAAPVPPAVTADARVATAGLDVVGHAEPSDPLEEPIRARNKNS